MGVSTRPSPLDCLKQRAILLRVASAELPRTRWRSSVGDRLTVAFADARVRNGVALLGYLGLTLLWFHRLVFNFNDSVLYGPNDASYGIRQYWGSEYFHSTPFTQTRDPLNGAPEGLPMAPAVQTANAIIPTAIWLLHYPFGFTGASNIFLLGGLVLTGWSFYLLLDRLGLHPFAAFYAGYALSFNPWMLERAGAGHSGFMQAWIFPLLIAVMLYANERRSVRSAIVVGAAIALAFYDNSYYGLMGAVIIGIFFVYDFVRQPTWGDRLWTFTLVDIAVATSAIVFLPALIQWAANPRAVGAGISNGVAQVQSLGATTQAYFLPSFRNPVLGKITTHFYPQAAYVWSENTLYLGWSLIVAGLIGAFVVWKRDAVTMLSPRTRAFAVMMPVVAIVAFLFSLQRETHWFGLTIPMPSYVISHFTTFWRVYARFGLLVTMALAALAAIALTVALRRYRRGWIVALAAFAVLGFEYYDGVLPIYKLQPMAYSNWIEKQPQGIVANYPMPTDNPAALRLLAETFYQQMYNKHPQFMLFGSGYGGTREGAIRDLVRYVTDPVTPSVLKAEGVKYVLLHDDVYRKADETPPPVPAGFHLVARIPGNVRALEIDKSVQPANLPQVLEQNAASLASVEGLPSPPVQVGPFVNGEASLTFSWTNDELRRVDLVVHAQTGGQPRSLSLLDTQGNVLGKWQIGGGDTQVSFGPLQLNGTSARYLLRVDPVGPMKVTSVVAQPLADFSVSIRDY